VGVAIWGEIELAYAFEKGKVLAVTGTNGKTTTTSLLGEIMQQAAEHVYVVGNIGNPYTDEVLRTEKDSVTVAEISSFQLETVHSFCPAVSAILNITPDHLNRHHTMENYVKVKQDIAKNQTKEQYCILNADDPYTKDFAKRCGATVVLFSSSQVLDDGFFYQDSCIFKAEGGKARKLMNIHEMKLLGMHNVENVMAAIAMADAFGVEMDKILAVVKQFQAVEHRIEFVATKNGVDYYNDSKGTNPDAAIKGIQAMEKPTYLIGGGYDKNSTYDTWIESFDGKVVKLVLLGQTKEKIAACAKEHGFLDYVFVDTLEEAMAYCSSHAREGEAVLLSPACASWGMFPNYEVRGRLFKDMVHAL
jgi:UDP-N-acetylmuramoylalanine--D-glutamate ligase